MLRSINSSYDNIRLIERYNGLNQYYQNEAHRLVRNQQII